MSSHAIRFGLGLLGRNPVHEMTEQARQAEQAGVDVVLLPDHLGMTSPLVPLVTMAEAAPSIRVGTLVLNCGFYRPALLARDLAAVDSATSGRLEIGLGTGYAESEFEAAGLPFPSPGRRVDLIEEHAREIRRLLSDPGHFPTPVQQPPPIMIGGTGDRLLATAAKHADIVNFLSMGDRSHLDDQVRHFSECAGDRLPEVELSFGFIQAAIDAPDDLSVLKLIAPDAPAEVLRSLIAYLPGPVERAAERIQSLHEELGISYFTLTLSPGLGWQSLEKLIAAVK